MKIKLLPSIAIASAMLFIISCDPSSSKESEPEPEPIILSPEEAQIEVRAANQDIITQRDDMISASGLDALMYLFDLMYADDEKASKQKAPLYSKRMTYSNALSYFRNNKELKSAILEEDDYYGIYEFNFGSDEFEMVSESSVMLQYQFPENEEEYINQNNNAELTITNLEFTEINSTEEYWNDETFQYENRPTTEEVPTNMDVLLTIDNQESLSATYVASYDIEGLPTAMSASFETGGYDLLMSQSGSNTNYTSVMEYKFNNRVIMKYNTDLTYSSDLSTVRTVSGYCLINPLKFNGAVNSDAIEQHITDIDENEVDPDIDYLNEQIDVKVIQTELNSTIGVLEYKMYHDYEWDEEYPAIVIVYTDGTYDWLEDVMTFIEE